MSKYTYLRYNILLMSVVGIFKVRTTSAIKKKLFRIWRAAMNLTTIYFTLAVIVDLIQKGSGNIELVVLNYVYVGICVTILFKMNYFYILDKETSGILQEMHDLFKYQTQTHLEEKDLSGSINLADKVTIGWGLLGSVVVQTFLLTLLISSKERILPLPVWFPYNWKISPLYELTIAYLIFMQQMMVLVTTGTDTYFASVIVLTCGQFRLLSWEVKHVLYTVLIKNGISKQDVDSVNLFKIFQKINGEHVHEDFNVEKIRAELLQNLNQLVQFHQSLLKFCHRLDDFFSPMYLPFFLFVIFIDVFIAFTFTTIKDLGFMVVLSCYLICANFTLLIPCYLGHLLTEETETLHYNIYDSPWYFCDKDFKTNLRIFQLRAVKPVILTVGKFSTLSLSAFLSILKTVISYVTVLYQLTEDNRTLAE